MTSARTLPPFRADHVGSLLRPPELREAHASFKAGKISEQDLGKIQDRAIQDVVRMQESIGLQSITDGEFRRDNWRDRFRNRIGLLVGALRQPIHLHGIFRRNSQGQADSPCRQQAEADEVHGQG